MSMCPIAGCEIEIKSDLPMCRWHWQKHLADRCRRSLLRQAIAHVNAAVAKRSAEISGRTPKGHEKYGQHSGRMIEIDTSVPLDASEMAQRLARISTRG